MPLFLSPPTFLVGGLSVRLMNGVIYSFLARFLALFFAALRFFAAFFTFFEA